jgi:hypothetical protein
MALKIQLLWLAMQLDANAAFQMQTLRAKLLDTVRRLPRVFSRGHPGILQSLRVFG